MPNHKLFFAALALCAIFLFNTADAGHGCPASHEYYSSTSGCSNDEGSLPGKCGASIFDCDRWGDCDIHNDTSHSLYGGSACHQWQSPTGWSRAVVDNDETCHTWTGYICACDKNCLLPQTNQTYYDQPTTAGTAQPENYVTLPVLLSWHDPNISHETRKAATAGYYGDNYNCGISTYSENGTDYTGCGSESQVQDEKQVPPAGTNSYLVDFLIYYTADEKDTSKRLIRFDSNEPPNPNDLNPPNPEGKVIDGTGPNGPAKLLEFVTDKQVFNSRDNGWPCFFNSDSTIFWRVRPCCEKKDVTKSDQSSCMPESNAVWWNFKTSPAPEPLGTTDNNHSKALVDPDWNGPKALGQDDPSQKIDFCTASLHWCSAKVASDKMSLNSNSQNSLEYQMMLNYNEAFTLKGILGGYYSQLEQNPWTNAILKAAEAAGATVGNPNQKACHYLLLQDDGKCQAEWIKTNQAKIPVTEFSNSINPNNNRDFFTKDLTYYWKLKSCFDNTNASVDENCHQSTDKNFGQEWKLMTNDATLAVPKIDAPHNDVKYNDEYASEPIGLPLTLSWEPPCGANSYQYQLENASGGSALAGDATPMTVARQVSFQKTAQTTASVSATRQNGDVVQANIELDKAYRWRVRPCWPSLQIGDHSKDSQLCEGNKWSDWAYFRTTGRPPQGLTTTPANPSYIPVTLGWQQVGGAKSYSVELSGGPLTAPVVKAADIGDPSKPASTQIMYPDIKPNNQPYKWRVRTCADPENCGPWSVYQSFVAKTLDPPAGPTAPVKQASLDKLPDRFSWTSVNGARGYRVLVSYSTQKGQDQKAAETNTDCIKQDGKTLVNEKVGSNSFTQTTMSLPCLGTYTWSVASCLSIDCKPDETGAPSTPWKFFINKGGGKSSGFMVCGLRDDDPSTPWDERKACDISGLFKFAEKLINFALFKLSFWLLPILVVITGGLFYTQGGGSDILKKVKKMWVWIGIGYALLFFAWLLTTWALSAFGYHGLWWKIL